MRRPIDILVDATPLESEHRTRGVGTYVRELTRPLAELAPERVRYLGSRVGCEHVPSTLSPYMVWGWRGHRPAQGYWLYNEWFLRTSLARSRPRLFHATDFNGLISVRGIRTVATLHDIMPMAHPREVNLSQMASQWRWKIYYQRKLPQADHVIVLSPTVRDQAVVTLGLSSDRVTVIPPGVDPRMSPDAAGQGAFANLGPYLLFVGNGQPNKNLSRVLSVWATLAPKHPGLTLCIAGPWFDEALVHWKRHAAAIGADSSVRWLGYVPANQLPSLYANAVALVFPSLDEGFGFPIVEAMASGTAVVTSRRPPMSTIAGDAAMLVDPESEASLIHGILAVVNRPAWRRELVERGMSRAAAFSWQRTAERTLALYDQVLASPLSRVG